MALGRSYFLHEYRVLPGRRGRPAQGTGMHPATMRTLWPAGRAVVAGDPDKGRGDALRAQALLAPSARVASGCSSVCSLADQGQGLESRSSSD